MKKIIRLNFIWLLLLLSCVSTVFSHPYTDSYSLKISNFLVLDQNDKLYINLEGTERIAIGFQLSLNNHTNSENALIILAFYNSDKSLENVTCYPYTITSNQPANVSIPAQIPEHTIEIKLIILSKDTLLPLTSVTNIDGNYDLDEYHISPVFSEGASLGSAPVPAIKGVVTGNSLLATETKNISFEAIIDDEWTYAENYSAFFTGKTEASITPSAGSVKFSYPVKKGDLINLSDLENIVINCSAKKLPKLNISNTDFSQMIKEAWVTASMTLEGGSKNFENAAFDGEIEIKGRGNSSWSAYPKKSYSLKLGSKTSLLDIPATKKYAIVSTFADSSFVRNYAAYHTALKYQGITYSPKCEYVECYFNDVYQGIYLLIERIDIESTKINIPDINIEKPNYDITGGYLIEKDVGDKIDKTVDLWFPSPYQANNAEDLFILKNPDPALPENIAYLTNHIQSLHNALMNSTGDEYKQYIDTNSWIDYLIHQEISKNIDGNMKSSTFLYKLPNDDKIYMGPLWDFDLAYGNAVAGWDTNGSGLPSANSNSGFMVANYSCPWYQQLMTKPEFTLAVKARYAAYRDTLYTDIFRMIDTQAAYLSEKAPADNIKWGQGTNIKTASNTLKTWINNRLNWLDTQWLP